MGRRKNRQRNLERRRTAKIAPYDRFLITCEGSLTEPRYIRALCRDLGINEANYRIISDCGNTPKRVVTAAIDEHNKNRDYDAVFCVFDRDCHTDFDGCVEQVRTKKLRRGRRLTPAKFEAITSVPAFEYWLLLHFRNSDAPFHPNDKGSATDNLIRELCKDYPGYSKNRESIYQDTRGYLNKAQARCSAFFDRAGGDCSANPSSRMHVLVDYIQQLR